jgi:hypothetical protein
VTKESTFGFPKIENESMSNNLQNKRQARNDGLRERPSEQPQVQYDSAGIGTV